MLVATATVLVAISRLADRTVHWKTCTCISIELHSDDHAATSYLEV